MRGNVVWGDEAVDGALCATLSLSSFAGDGSYKLAYDGGSVGNYKSGTSMKLYLQQDHIKIVKGEEVVVDLPASSITEISYGQDVHRRVGAAIGLAMVSFGVGALMALTKSKKHYIGLT